MDKALPGDTMSSTMSTHTAQCCLLSGSRAYGHTGHGDSHEEEGLVSLSLLKWKWQAGCPRTQVPASLEESSRFRDPRERDKGRRQW